MRLFDATLDLARYAQGIETHKVSTARTNGKEFTCESLSARSGEYTNGGTCWFLTGESEGHFGEIARAINNTVELRSSLDTDISAGDNVALSWFHYFNTQNLINAINHVLYDYPIMEIFEDRMIKEPEHPEEEEAEEAGEDIRPPHHHGHHGHHGFWHHGATGEYEYELPEEVSIDIRRVEIQTRNFHLPFPNIPGDSFTICHYWQLKGRTLVIDPRWMYHMGGEIKIYYVRDHGMIIDPEEETISEQVDKNYLRKMANLWLWTHEIQMKHKDNPIAVDMYNQAKMDEDTLNKKNIPESRLIPKDICYFW